MTSRRADTPVQGLLPIRPAPAPGPSRDPRAGRDRAAQHQQARGGAATVFEAARAGVHTDTPFPLTFLCTQPWDLHTLVHSHTHCPQQAGTSPAHRIRHNCHTQMHHMHDVFTGPNTHTHTPSICKHSPWMPCAHTHGKILPHAQVHKSLTLAHTFHAFPYGCNPGRGQWGYWVQLCQCPQPASILSGVCPALQPGKHLNQCPRVKHTLTNIPVGKYTYNSESVCICTHGHPTCVHHQPRFTHIWRSSWAHIGTACPRTVNPHAHAKPQLHIFP